MLHLARARNQLLYATRSLDGFDETEAALRQLVEQGHYGGYPHYLLSIAHRLAAEIYRGSSGTRDDSLVRGPISRKHSSGRNLGQEADPQKDRPIAAEAECLESMGRYAEGGGSPHAGDRDRRQEVRQVRALPLPLAFALLAGGV